MLIDNTTEISVQAIAPTLYGTRWWVTSSKNKPTADVRAIAVVRQANPIAKAIVIVPHFPKTEWEMCNKSSVRCTLSVKE